MASEVELKRKIFRLIDKKNKRELMEVIEWLNKNLLSK
jgi:hypothetical protein